MGLLNEKFDRCVSRLLGTNESSIDLDITKGVLIDYEDLKQVFDDVGSP